MPVSTHPAKNPIGTGLTFGGMTDLGIAHGFDLKYSILDKSAEVYLYVGEQGNRIRVTGTTPLSRQEAMLKAIDQFGKWGQTISLWMVSEKNGVRTIQTQPVSYVTHVKPYYGTLTISGIAKDEPAMTYPGNGKGRLLSKPISGRYYFIYGGKLETDNDMRGFDCTTFPMALFSISRLTPPGYGKQLCDALGAEQCGIELTKRLDLEKRFKQDNIPSGIYVLFSEGHVMLYNSDVNILYEFTFGGFRSTPAGQRHLQAPRGLWWMRKLSEAYRPYFA